MQIKMDYGRSGLNIEVPDDADVFLVRETFEMHFAIPSDNHPYAKSSRKV